MFGDKNMNDENKYGDICEIYIIKNTINDKYYVGQTWVGTQKRFKQHKNEKRNSCIKLFNAFNCHGRENFYVEHIASIKTNDQKEVDDIEDFVILQYNCIENGYNVRRGGSTGKLSEDTKRKISEANIGKPGLIGEYNPMFGKTGILSPRFCITHTDEVKKKMSENMMGKYVGEDNHFFEHHHTEENKILMSELTKARVQGENNPFYGKEHTEETKQLLSELTKARVQGEDNPMFGKKHSDETIYKISNSRKGQFVGDKNPMFGKRHSPELLKQIAESNRGKFAWNKGIPNSDVAKQKMKDAWVKRKAKKQLEKQMKEFYNSTIYCDINNLIKEVK